MNLSHRSAQRPPSRERLTPAEDAPRTHEDAVDLIEREFNASVIAAHGYDERTRAMRSRSLREREAK